jgi:UDP-N-acetyl-2-amino-2-deoxyglucuronate dehydrogenase
MPESLKVALLTEPGGPHLSIYIDLLGRNPAVTEVSVADSGGAVFAECRERWQTRFGEIPTYLDYRDLLRERRPDLVVVCFASDHAPAPIENALRAGCHVLAEKPACVRADDFERLHHLARQANRHLMLAFATRSNPLVIKARELVRQGALGKLYGATAWFVADQARLRTSAYHDSWFASKKHAGGGNLIWLGIHYVDALQFITGQRIERVCGFAANVGGQPMDVEDTAAVALEFEGGMVGTLQSGYYLDRSYHSQIGIWGADGWLRADLISGAPLEWHLNSEQQVRQLAPPVPAQDAYAPFIQAVLDSVRNGTPPPVESTECLQVLRAVFGLYEAAASGQTRMLA